MSRNALTILVAFTVALLGAHPNLAAQYSGPSEDQGRGAYPSIAQPATPAGAQPSAPAADPSNDGDGGGVAPSDANAQMTPEQEAAADQKHGVARLSIVQGDVNVKRGDSGGELVAAVQNAPLLSEDHLQTGNGSRAEIELDSANLVRLAPNTDVAMADLEYHRYHVQLGAGTIIYRVLRHSDAQVEVDTPNVGFRPVGEGEFRISVLEDGTTQITARMGQGEIFGPRGSEQLPAGATLTIRGDASDPEFRTTAAVARDTFDDWSEHRDGELLRSQSYRYVSTDIPGAEDLDQNGQWVPSQYGQVWTPQGMPADWSPYSTGEWTWQDYYGWTWVDSAAWGWAPYHYGRWFYNGGYGWCWWPGALRSSYYWSPALVGFWGWGGGGGFGFGIGFGFGGLGWCALAPFERYHRWWGPGWYHRGWDGRYGEHFRPYNNFTRGADIARMYRNASYRGGALTARGNAFGGPHQHFMPATRAQLTNVSAFRGGPMPVAPTRASYRFSTRNATANPRLAGAANRHFFESAQFRNGSGQSRNGSMGNGARFNASGGFRPENHTPRGVPSSGFRGQAVQPVAGSHNGWTRLNGASGRSIGETPQQSGHGVPPNMQSRFAQRGNSPASRSTASGWQRFGDPGNGGALRQGFAGSNERSGWHSFGQPEGSRTSQRSSFSSGYSGSRGGAPAYNQPRYNQPRYNQPSYRAPAFNQPRYSASPSYQPRYNAPRYNIPSRSSAPRFETPRSSAPHFSAPSGGGFSHGGGSSGGSHGGGFSGGGGHGGGSHGGGGGHHR